MINYLPTPYEDELFYSVLCRAYTHSGYLSSKVALRDMLFARSNNPSIEFIGHLNSAFEAMVKEAYSFENLIFQHTMFPQYARFLPLQAKQSALYHLSDAYCDPHHLFCILPRAPFDFHLKYCPMCAKEDKDSYGETFWHRSHQIRYMLLCPKHYCLLEQSAVLANSEKVFTLCSAEKYAPITSPKTVSNSALADYCKYIHEVFQAPISITSNTPISAVFYYALQGTKYMPKSLKVRNTKQLSKDLRGFYNGIGITDSASIYQIQRTLLGERFDFSVVCQLAFFLGISVKDLTEPCLTKEQITSEQASHYMVDKSLVDWSALDKEIAPQLERLASDTYYGTYGRPSRVSEKMVYRELHLSAHSLENLPISRAILEQYSETYEESWARRLVWAYEKLKKESNDSPFYWSDLRYVSGVKKEKLERIVPFIFKHTSATTAKAILSLLHSG